MMFCCCNKAFTFIWFGTLMDRYSGISDFRFISGIFGLSYLEHAGIFVSLANFTILPGAFSWHVKSLFMKGQYIYESLLTKYALDVLSLTWFFSSLYLIYLYIVLFLKPARGLFSNSSQTISSSLSSRNSNKLRSFFNVFISSLLTNVPNLLHTKLSIVNTKKSFYNNIDYFVYNSVTNIRGDCNGTSIRRMSTSFFVILTISLIFLVQSSNFFFYSYVDMSWIVDTFCYSNFIVGDFYS
jgi:hypothetical protein